MKFSKLIKLILILAGILILILIYQKTSSNPYENKLYITSFIVIQSKNKIDNTITVYDQNNDKHNIYTLKVKDKAVFNWIKLDMEYLAQYIVDNRNLGELMFIKSPNTVKSDKE